MDIIVYFNIINYVQNIMNTDSTPIIQLLTMWHKIPGTVLFPGEGQLPLKSIYVNEFSKAYGKAK